ncbi:hypothetical protein [Scytonema hofmannii]|nr:hypothetical protein [Scytonema hofmannii]
MTQQLFDTEEIVTELDIAGIGLILLWEGQFEEDVTRLWLRWCDKPGTA